MNAAQVLDHFDRICDAPDAIPRLRRFIIDLAVRGKLVDQDPNDEPALDLLKRIESEKEQLLNNERVPYEKPVPTVNAGKVDFEIPQNWTWVRLGKVIKLWNGFAFRSSDFQTQGIPVIRIGDLQGGEVVLSSAVYVSEQVANSVAPEVWIPTGALLIAMSGATTGKVAFNRSGRRLLLNQRVGRVQSFLISQDFLKFFFDSIVTRNLSISFGTAIPNLSTQQINHIYFPLPPLDEQHRIVAKVDELIALCDRLEAAQAERESRRDKLAAASLHRLNNGADAAKFREHARFHLRHFPRLTTRPEDIQQLHQAILNLAIQGKLIPQDPKDEPAAAMLKRVQVEKIRLEKDGTIKKERHLEAVTADAAPFVIPESWKWVRLGELTELITKGSSPKWQGIEYVSKDFGLLFITSENVGNYRLRKLDDLKYVEKRFNEIEPRSILRFGDILMNLVGASIGRTAIYDLDDDANINQAVALIRLIQITANIKLEFLLHYLNSPSAIEFMFGSQVVTAQPNISLTNVREFPIPFPPLAEQHRIVAKVDELMALCDRLEMQLTMTQTETRRLFEAVLHKALNGGAEIV